MSSRILLNNVETVELGFTRGGGESAFWRGDTGAALGVLPDLIEITFVFEDTTRFSIAALSGGRQ